MARIPFQRQHSGTFAGDLAQRTAQRTAQELNATKEALDAVPILDGVAVTGVVFAAGVAQTVTHGLGRALTGYLVTRAYGANVSNSVGESGAAAADPLNKVVMITTLACTRDFWFY